MTKAEREAARRQAERAAGRHRKYVEQLRKEVSRQTLQEEQAAERRQERLASLRQDANRRRAAERQQWQPTPMRRPALRPVGSPAVTETERKPAGEHVRPAEHPKRDIAARAAQLRAKSEQASLHAKLRSRPEPRTLKPSDEGQDLRRQISAVQRQAI